MDTPLRIWLRAWSRGPAVWLLALTGYLGGFSASGAVLCPRVLSEHTADVTDLGRFRDFAAWEDCEGQDLAIAIWKYLCGEETGLYHMAPIKDGPDPWEEYSTVRDPIKLMNVYNVGYCGIFGPVLDGIFQGAGFETGRAFGVPGWNHCTTEVWYGGGWHYFDLDVRGALMKPDGTIASVLEAQNDRGLWVVDRPGIEPFFPKDPDKEKIYEIYRDSRIDYYYRWFQAGHVMDFRLRQGESLTRWWHPQGGRWHHLPDFNQGYMRALLEKAPRGYKSNHPNFTIWTQGNGLWNYQPDLTDASDDFADGVEEVQNLRPGPRGLQLVADGSGEAVFEVFTPWIIVPRVHEPGDPKDDEEASVVRLEAARRIEVFVSTDHGKRWQHAAAAIGGANAVDLTPWVKGTYGYRLKLACTGRAGDEVLRSITMRTWVQVAPMSLPRLQAGVNHCRYEIGDRYGRTTMPRFIHPNLADPEDLRRHVVEMQRDYDPERRTKRVVGQVVFRLESPPGYFIDWLTAGACFSTYQNEAAARTDNRIAYAVGEPVKFREIYRAAVPLWVNHWRYQWDQDVRLDRPAEVVFVKYTGDPGVNVLRATLHLQTSRKPRQALQITHAYKIGAEVIKKEVAMREPGDYTVVVDGVPENLFVRMAVPSAREPLEKALFNE